MTIGQVAKQCGVGVETIRFYERKGLIPAGLRRASGYRQFPPDTVPRIHFIQRAKDLGFPPRIGSRLHSAGMQGKHSSRIEIPAATGVPPPVPPGSSSGRG